MPRQRENVFEVHRGHFSGHPFRPLVPPRRSDLALVFAPLQRDGLEPRKVGAR